MKSNKIYFGILVLSQTNTEISKTLYQYIICSCILYLDTFSGHIIVEIIVPKFSHLSMRF